MPTTLTFSPEQMQALTDARLEFLLPLLQGVEDLNTTMQVNIAAQAEAETALHGDIDALWILFCAVMVFLMQAGFAMLCAGCVQEKNVMNIMLKNVLDACVGALGFWSVGYAFAYGAADGGNPFIGDTYFFLTNFEGNDTFHSWFFQFAFAATAATIVSGAVAERCQFVAYIAYAFFLTTWVYPVVVHWIWSGQGWLSAFTDDPLFGIGVVDFAGCGVVHMVGGLSGLIGAWMMGSRTGRFDLGGQVVSIPGHSIPLQVLGTFILWAGWYGFNPGSTLAIVGLSHIAAKTATTTTLSAVSGGVTNLFVWKWISKRTTIQSTLDVSMALNGVLAGLVSITSGCSVVEPFAAVIIGVVASFVYTGSSLLVKKLQIDDVVDAGPVHFFCGMWGLISAALFCTKENLMNAYGKDESNTIYGLFYGGGGELLACNFIAILAIIAWVGAMMTPFFYTLHKLKMLRVDLKVEEEGLDVSKHGGSAYVPKSKADAIPLQQEATATASC